MNFPSAAIKDKQRVSQAQLERAFKKLQSDLSSTRGVEGIGISYGKDDTPTLFVNLNIEAFSSTEDFNKVAKTIPSAVNRIKVVVETIITPDFHI